jgi:O-antigen ligase
MIILTTASFYIISIFIFSHFSELTLLPKLFAILLTTVYIISALREQKPIVQISLCHGIFILWIFTAVLSGLFSGNPSGNLKRAWTLCQVLIVSIILYGCLLRRPDLKWVAWIFLIATLISALGADFGLISHTASQNVPIVSEQRFSGTLGNPNIFGYTCVVSLTFAILLWRAHPNNLIRLFLLSAAFYLMIKTADTGSRKAILGLLIIFSTEYLVSVFAKGEVSRSKRFLIICSGAIALFVIGGSFTYFVMKGSHSHRLRNIGHFFRGEQLEKGEQSLHHRVLLYETGWKMFQKNPAFGSGLASFSEARIGHFKWKSIGTYSHSNIMEILVSSGLIGFIIYYSIYAVVAKRLLKFAVLNRRAVNDPVFRFLAVIIPFTLFFDFFAITYYVKEFWIVLTVVFAGTKILNDKIYYDSQHTGIERFNERFKGFSD